MDTVCSCSRPGLRLQSKPRLPLKPPHWLIMRTKKCPLLWDRCSPWQAHGLVSGPSWILTHQMPLRPNAFIYVNLCSLMLGARLPLWMFPLNPRTGGGIIWGKDGGGVDVVTFPVPVSTDLSLRLLGVTMLKMAKRRGRKSYGCAGVL